MEPKFQFGIVRTVVIQIYLLLDLIINLGKMIHHLLIVKSVVLQLDLKAIRKPLILGWILL